MVENQAAIDAHKANPRAMPPTSTERSERGRPLGPRYTSPGGSNEAWYASLSFGSVINLAKLRLFVL